MDRLSEEEIIKDILDLARILDKTCESGRSKESDKIRVFVDLYNKEKEKNKELFLQYEKEVDKLEYQITTMISKDKIRELLQMYDKGISWANADDHYYFVKFIKELLEEK